MLDWQLGSKQIPSDVDWQLLRDSDEFTALELEINKLIDIHAEGSTNWELVSSLANKILSEQGKDLTVAIWLVAAWVQLDNALGLAAGLHVLRDLHDQYWDTMLPPARRIRGRRNQMDWLLDNLEKSFEKHDADDWSALTDEQFKGLQDDWDFVDSFWQAKDDEAPSFFKLRKYIDALSVVSDDAASTNDDSADPELMNANASTDVGIGNQSASDIQAKQSNTDQQEQAPQATDTATASKDDAQALSAKSSTQTGSSSSSQKSSSPTSNSSNEQQSTNLAVDATSLDTVTAIENHIEQGMQFIQRPLPDVTDELLHTPLMYRFNRQCAWLIIDQLPNASDGITAIPAPRPTDQDSLQNLIDSDDTNAILRFCESKLPTYRFWLDLNYIAYQAAIKNPNTDLVAQTILQETAYFVGRLPGLIDLSFNDEQAFANADTKSWLLTGLDSQLNQNNASVSNVVNEAPKPKNIQTSNNFAATTNTGDTIAYATTLAVASAETRAALNLLEVVADRLQAAANNLNTTK